MKKTSNASALDRFLKEHKKHCNYWVFSSDRHCSCGRDEAIRELEGMRAALSAQQPTLVQLPMLVYQENT
jgi:hypothetical protein